MDQQVFTVIRDYCKLRANGDAEKYLMLIDQMFEANGYPKLNIVTPPYDDVTILYDDTPSQGSSLEPNELTDTSIHEDSPDQNETPGEVLSRIDSPRPSFGPRTDLNDTSIHEDSPDQTETPGEVLSRIELPRPSFGPRTDLNDTLNRPGPSSANTFIEPSTPVRLHGSQTDLSDMTDIAIPARAVKRKRGHDSKPFCPHCNAVFKYRSHVKIHLASQGCVRVSLHCTMNNNKWRCNMCGHEFSTVQTALEHLKKAHNKGHKIYICPVCHEDFERYASSAIKMTAHIEKDHPDYWGQFGL